MDNSILSKANRLEKPKTVAVPLRKGVYDALSRIAMANRCPVACVVRAIVEDFYDCLPADPADPEVPDNE